MPDYVVTATRANGEWIKQYTTATAPTLAQIIAFGDEWQVNYVSSRHDHTITLYGRDIHGVWGVVGDGPAPVVVVLRSEHDALRGPRGRWP